MSRTRPDRWFAGGAVAVAAVALAVVIVLVITGGGNRDITPGNGMTNDDPASVARGGVDLSNPPAADPNVDVSALVDEVAATMGAVESVQFALARTGAPVFIDQFQSIALNSVLGQFVVPAQAQATIEVTIEDSLNTRLGVIALGDEIWVSNPVTGNFETLPPGYDLDPSRLFDPAGGWQPLLENLTAVELVGVVDRDGERYQIRGVAAAADVSNITVGLVRDQDVTIDLWVYPGTPYVTAAEFTTVIDGESSDWSLDLSHYGAEFTIEPPAGVTSMPASTETGAAAISGGM